MSDLQCDAGKVGEAESNRGYEFVADTDGTGCDRARMQVSDGRAVEDLSDTGRPGTFVHVRDFYERFKTGRSTWGMPRLADARAKQAFKTACLSSGGLVGDVGTEPAKQAATHGVG